MLSLSISVELAWIKGGAAKAVTNCDLPQFSICLVGNNVCFQDLQALYLRCTEFQYDYPSAASCNLTIVGLLMFQST